MIYALFAIALSLACVAGLQFAYLSFVQASNLELKRRVKELERALIQSGPAVPPVLLDPQLAVVQASAPPDDSWPELISDDRT